MRNSIVFIVVFLLSLSVNAESKSQQHSPVNILVWWNYLDKKIADEAEKKCNVKISYDEYYSNGEFIRRFNTQMREYEIVIFSSTIYELIKKNIPEFNTNLWMQSLTYHPISKQHYEKEKYKKNVIYFVHTLTGFLFNKRLISLLPQDSAYSIFSKAKNNVVVLTDDPVEVIKLINLDISSKDKQLSTKIAIEQFKKTTQNSHVYITNDYATLFQKNNFAFSYSWSAIAMIYLNRFDKKMEDYGFLIHPSLSNISTDLLVQLKDEKHVNCVANFLSDKKTLNYIQNKIFYFSPYWDINNVKDPNFKKIYAETLKKLPELGWISSVNTNYFEEINRSWELLKLQSIYPDYVNSEFK